LLGEQTGEQLIGLTELVFLEDDDQLMEIPREFSSLTFCSAGSVRTSLPVLWCATSGLRWVPGEVILIQTFEKEVYGSGEESDSARRCMLERRCG